MDRALNAVREFISKESSFFEPFMQDVGAPADHALKDELVAKGMEFEPGSCFHVLIHTTIPDCDMINRCKMAAGLKAKMVQGQYGHREKEMVRPGWQSLRITYDLRDLDEYDTSPEKIFLTLWRHFCETEMRILRDEPTDWEESLTISKWVGLRWKTVVKVELWPKDKGKQRQVVTHLPMSSR